MSAGENIDLVIKEYEATQDMIKHYDDIIMRFATMSQGGVLIFVGLAFSLLSKDRTIFLCFFPIVILFVATTNAFIHLWFRRHRAIARIKIRRVLELERNLGSQQFSMVDEAIRSKEVGSKPVHTMLIFYHLSLPILLTIAYVLILYLEH